MSKNLNRRAMLAGASAVPAIAIAPSITAASEPDPILAAAKRYEKAWDDLTIPLQKRGALVDVLPEERRQWEYHVSEPAPPAGNNDAPEWIAAQDELTAAWREVDQAIIAFVDTQPTTTAGASYAVEFVLHRWELEGSEWTLHHTGEYDPQTGDPLYCELMPTFLESLRDGLRKIGAAA
jgi:hypothetical protein